MSTLRRSLGLPFAVLFSLLAMACSSSSARVASRDLQLIRASERGHTKEMFRLIQAGADINAQDEEGWTPYLAASSMGHFEAMRMLRAFGARTEAPEMEPEPTAQRYIRN
jgi:ankyrin repeat protein